MIFKLNLKEEPDNNRVNFWKKGNLTIEEMDKQDWS